MAAMVVSAALATMAIQASQHFLGINLIPAGPAGPTGPAGGPGPAGANGVDGVDGEDGISGTTVHLSSGAPLNQEDSEVDFSTGDINLQSDSGVISQFANGTWTVAHDPSATEHKFTKRQTFGGPVVVSFTDYKVATADQKLPYYAAEVPVPSAFIRKLPSSGSAHVVVKNPDGKIASAMATKSFILSGIAAASVNGQRLVVQNRVTAIPDGVDPDPVEVQMTIVAEDGAKEKAVVGGASDTDAVLAVDRIALGPGRDAIVLEYGEIATFVYDASVSRWVLVSSSSPPEIAEVEDAFLREELSVEFQNGVVEKYDITMEVLLSNYFVRVAIPDMKFIANGGGADVTTITTVEPVISAPYLPPGPRSVICQSGDATAVRYRFTVLGDGKCRLDCLGTDVFADATEVELATTAVQWNRPLP